MTDLRVCAVRHTTLGRSERCLQVIDRSGDELWVKYEALVGWDTKVLSRHIEGISAYSGPYRGVTAVLDMREMSAEHPIFALLERPKRKPEPTPAVPAAHHWYGDVTIA